MQDSPIFNILEIFSLSMILLLGISLPISWVWFFQLIGLAILYHWKIRTPQASDLLPYFPFWDWFVDRYVIELNELKNAIVADAPKGT